MLTRRTHSPIPEIARTTPTILSHVRFVRVAVAKHAIARTLEAVPNLVMGSSIVTSSLAALILLVA
ncbi:MAG: hypothetical protein ACJ746_31430 [Bryobacteraceae bacterium]